MTPPRDWTAAVGQATLAATLMLAVGGTLAVLAAWAVQRRCRDSRAALWVSRGSVVWLLVLLLAEVFGFTAPVAAWICRCRGDAPRAAASAHASQRPAGDSTGGSTGDSTGGSTGEFPIDAPPAPEPRAATSSLIEYAASGARAADRAVDPSAGNGTASGKALVSADACQSPLGLSPVEADGASPDAASTDSISPPRHAGGPNVGRVGSTSAAANSLADAVSHRVQSEGSDAGSRAAWVATSLHRAGALWLVVWVAVAVVLAIRHTALRWVLLRRCRQLHPVTDQALLRTVREVAARVECRGRFTVRAMRGIAGPLACGGWRATLVVPADFAERFSPPQQRAILAHEMAHLAGRDLLWQQLAAWTVTFYWWHPAAWWAVRALRTASETLADEASTIVEDGPQRLAECLVQLGESLLLGARRPRWAAEGMAVVGTRFRSTLGRRVVRLLELQAHGLPRQRSRRWVPLAVAGGFVAMVVGLVGSVWARPELPQLGDGTVSVWSKPWRNSLAGLALLGLAGVVVSDDAPPKPGEGAQAAAAASQAGTEKDEGGRSGAAHREERTPREAAHQEANRPDRPAPRPEGREGEAPRPGARGEGHPPRPAGREGEGPRPDAREGHGPRASASEGHPPRAEGREGPPPGEGPGPRGPAADVMRRVHHLMVAAENLRAAGFPDQAQALQRQAEELRRSAHLPMPPRSEEPRGEPGRRAEGPPPGERGPRGEPAPREGGPREGTPRPGPRAEGPPQGPPPAELFHVLRQMREEIERLRQEVNELRSRLGRGQE